MKRFLSALVVIAFVGIGASACMSLLDSPAPAPAQPVIVTNNVPSGGDSGATVLLAVVGVFAFLLFATTVLAGWNWASERRRRLEAENVVLTITGQPMTTLRLAAAPPISTERLHAMAFPARPHTPQLEQ